MPQSSSTLAVAVLSSRPDTVTGGDALIEVRFAGDVDGDASTVRAGAFDVTAAFTVVDGERQIGLVDGLALGDTAIEASAPGQTPAVLVVSNWPIAGPMISGPHQAPFACRTVESGLGEPLDGDCSVATRYEYFYKNDQGMFVALADPAQVPADALTVMNSGGSITYNCIGANFYEITLDLYLDCSGAALTAQNLQLSNDCGVNFTLNNIPLVLTEEVSQLCPSSLANSTCNGGPLLGIRHYRFVTTVFLSPCDDWTIAWNICCRNAVQNLVGTQGMYLEATVNNAGGFCDDSPVIADNSIPFVCVDQPVVYSPGISDPDGHTMQFDLIAAQFAAPAPTNINYQPGFNAANPIPGIVLDPTNGQISFTPTVTGSYVMSILRIVPRSIMKYFLNR